MTLSAAKFNRIMSGANAQMLKVYDAVPIAEYWSVKNIDAALRRQGRNMDHAAVAGLLDSLKRIGMIVERSGEFIRTEVKEPNVNIPENVVKAVKPAPQTPMQLLRESIYDLEELGNTMLRLHEKFENAIKAIEAEQSVESDEIKKLRALKDMLKHVIE